MSSTVPSEIIRNPQYKLLPPSAGNNWLDSAFRCNHTKKQALYKEFAGLSATCKPCNTSFTATQEKQQSISSRAKEYLQSLTSNRENFNSSEREVQRYTSLDDKVLRFYAAFREHIPDSGVNEYWHRHVTICFFPLDDTLLIYEPKEENNGLLGGTLLKRQKVTLDADQQEECLDDRYITINYLNVGKAVRINGVNYFIYDCDLFTRKFLTSLGVIVGERIHCPFKVDVVDHSMNNNRFVKVNNCHFSQLDEHIINEQTFDIKNDDTSKKVEFKRKSKKINVLDNYILRFYGLLQENYIVSNLSCGRSDSNVSCEIADDTVKMAKVINDATNCKQHVRWMEFYLFLSDMSVAIAEKNFDGVNGAEHKCKYLSRCLLPKSGTLSKATELTFSNIADNKATMVRNADFATKNPDEYYSYMDFFIGAHINVFGRQVFIYDCDDFTREFYKQELNKELANAFDVTLLKPTALNKSKRIALPSNNKCEQRNCDKRDLLLGKNEQREIESNQASKRVLRFFMLLQYPTNVDEAHQRYTLTYYVDTCELSIYVKSILPNSGYTNACFLKRQKVYKDEMLTKPFLSLKKSRNVNLVNDKDHAYYMPEDFCVGAVLRINGFLFKITEEDADTEAFYSKVNTHVTVSNENVQRLYNELCDYCNSRFGTSVKTFLAFDRDKDGFISKTEFLAALRDYQLTNENLEVGSALFEHLYGKGICDVITFEDTVKWTNSNACKYIFPKGEQNPHNSSFTNARENIVAIDNENNVDTFNKIGHKVDHKNVSNNNIIINNNDSSCSSNNNNNDDNNNSSQRVESRKEDELIAYNKKVKLLILLKEKVESKFMKMTDFFCLISSMPRAYSVKSCETNGFTNVHRNATITPVQFEIALNKSLGFQFTVDENKQIIDFFFNVNNDNNYYHRDGNIKERCISLQEFKTKFQQMSKFALLDSKIDEEM